MSYASEVIADKTGKWIPNSMRFATHEEARAWALDLAQRWSAVRYTRIIETQDPVTHTFLYGKLERKVD